MRYTSIATAAALACVPLTAAHSWIQQLRNVDDDGKYVGNWGYPRGLCPKGAACDPGIENNWLLPDPPTEPGLFISDKSMLCKPSQRKPEQLDPQHYPRLQTVPGMHIALRYSENGHVSLNGTPNENTNKWKASKGGTIFIYGTADPKEDEKLVDVLRWTRDGKGGDGRGVLIGTNDFDDGRCYEVNSSPIAAERKAKNPSYAMGQTGQGNGFFGLPCESDIALPNDTATGKPYTLYWVWQWNTPPNRNPVAPLGKDEYYTTCIDVDVVDTLPMDANATAKYPTPQQDDTTVAVPDFKSRTALYTDAIMGEIGPYFKGNQSTPATQPPYGNSSAPSAPISTGLPAQPSQNPSDGNIGNGDVVTLTDIVYVTVSAPNSAPTTLVTSAISSPGSAPTTSPATSAISSPGSAPTTSLAPTSDSVRLPDPTGVPQLSSRPVSAAALQESQPSACAKSGRNRRRFYRV